ncbi:MAG: hypothetical protein QOJ86_642 [Bradyrhizobium sp.]|jgi:hypothetical protein|nr:hypothetical protein [Bradyrhizobium sp.]
MAFKSTEIATIAVAGIAFIGSVVSAFYTYANRNRELDIKLVEIGIGILRADPKGTDLTPARAWAIQVIEDNSKVKFSDDDRRSLLQKPLLFRPTASASTQTSVVVPDKNMQEFLEMTAASGGTIVQRTKQNDGTWVVVVNYPAH